MGKRKSRAGAPARKETPLAVLTPSAVLKRADSTELAELFSSKEVKRLRLVVLTSADPRERVTAIRRLALAPGTPEEKAAALLTALADDEPKVRLEAIRALVPLGLNPDVAREAERLTSGTDKQKLASARRIGEMTASAAPGEMSVLLTLIAGTLKTDLPDAARRSLIEALAPAAPVLAHDPQQLAGTVALIAEQVTERPSELSRPARTVLSALAREETDGTVDALAQEAGRAPDADARRVLLGAFSSIHVPAERREQIAKRMVEELLVAPEPETTCLGIANALCRWGATAAKVLLEHLHQAVRQQKTFMLRILDDIATREDCPPRTRRAVAQRFLDLLKTDTPATRAVLLDCAVFADRSLPNSLRRDIAAELIQHVHEFGGPRMVGAIEDTIARLGEPAIEPLIQVLNEGVRDRERISAARVLASIVAQLSGRSRRASQIAGNVLMACVRRLDRGFPDRDALAAAIGRMCTSRAMPADTVRRVARGLRARVGKEPYSLGLLEGLGHVASSPHVALETRVEVAESLLRLLEVDLPEMQSKRFTGGEKTIFIVGREAAAYTDMIPILLDGLRNVCVHAASLALHDRVVALLVRKWRDAANWRLVWGPANTLKLAEVLGDIALAANCPAATRLEVAEALASTADTLPVLRVLGRLFAVDSDSAEMGELAANVAGRLLERLAPGSGDRIETDATLMAALAAIGARRRLGPKEEANRLRRAIAAVLFKALRNGAPGAKAALETLGSSPAIAEELRSEIEVRLAQT